MSNYMGEIDDMLRVGVHNLLPFGRIRLCTL